MVDRLAELPRTRHYLSSVPAGFESYPEAVVKGSVVRMVVDAPPPGFVAERLPEPLRKLMEEPPTLTEWIPEVYTVAMTHALRDLSFSSEKALFDWVEVRLEELTTGRLYRAMASMASPHQLVRLASRAYQKFRRGTSRTIIEKADNYNVGLIEYPEYLYDSLYTEVVGISLLGPYRLSRAKNPGWEVLEWTPTAAKLKMIYDVDAETAQE